ncbi:unnamed protein product, partial [Ectocarpus sp. 12 AP-2014]
QPTRVRGARRAYDDVALAVTVRFSGSAKSAELFDPLSFSWVIQHTVLYFFHHSAGVGRADAGHQEKKGYCWCRVCKPRSVRAVCYVTGCPVGNGVLVVWVVFVSSRPWRKRAGGV